jgi:hypothetical protein
LARFICRYFFKPDECSGRTKPITLVTTMAAVLVYPFVAMPASSSRHAVK